MTLTLPSNLVVSSKDNVVSGTAGTLHAVAKNIAPVQTCSASMDFTCEIPGDYVVNANGIYWPTGNKDMFQPLTAHHALRCDDAQPSPTQTPTPRPIQTSRPTQIPQPTRISQLTQTPRPTRAPQPTSTTQPTQAPIDISNDCASTGGTTEAGLTAIAGIVLALAARHGVRHKPRRGRDRRAFTKRKITEDTS